MFYLKGKCMYLLEIEGVDGCGKSTAVKYVVEQLRIRGYKTLETREVGNIHIPFCSKLRELILDPEYKLSGEAMELAFSCMRTENQRFYRSVENDYDFCVSDRGLLSHAAYGEHNATREFMEDLYFNILNKYTIPPDMVLFLDVKPEMALARRQKRNGFVDAIEAKGQEFQVKVLDSFHKYIEQLDLPVTFIDANQDLDNVKRQIDELIEAL